FIRGVSLRIRSISNLKRKFSDVIADIIKVRAAGIPDLQNLRNVEEVRNRTKRSKLTMRSSVTFDGLQPIERLEHKVSPTTRSVGGIVDSWAETTSMHAANDDPPPEPEPPLPPYPGEDPPIDHPLAPPSGPAGPGR